jgi:hypothetical protein
MPYTFNRRASIFTAPDGIVMYNDAYSGHGPGLNNPDMETVHNVGPIPAGLWLIGDPLNPPDKLGPLAMPLTPAPGTDPKGRVALFIHGDKPAMNHTASDGCVILPRTVRAAVAGGATGPSSSFKATAARALR